MLPSGSDLIVLVPFIFVLVEVALLPSCADSWNLANLVLRSVEIPGCKDLDTFALTTS